MYIWFLRVVRECEYYMSMRLSGDKWSYVPLTQRLPIQENQTVVDEVFFYIFIDTMLTFQDLRKEGILS